MQLLIQQLMEGCPEQCKNLPVTLQLFYQVRNTLAIMYTCIIFQGSFYIPSLMRKECFQALQQVPPGTVKIKLRSQKSMCWKGLNKEVENCIMRCEPCQATSTVQQKEPVKSMEIPKGLPKDRFRLILLC